MPHISRLHDTNTTQRNDLCKSGQGLTFCSYTLQDIRERVSEIHGKVFLLTVMFHQGILKGLNANKELGHFHDNKI